MENKRATPRNKRAFLENKTIILENKKAILQIKGHFWEVKGLHLRTRALATTHPHPPSPLSSGHFWMFQVKVFQKIFQWVLFFCESDILTFKFPKKSPGWGKTSPALFWKSKKCVLMLEKMPYCEHYCLKLLFQYAVLRNLRNLPCPEKFLVALLMYTHIFKRLTFVTLTSTH